MFTKQEKQRLQDRWDDVNNFYAINKREPEMTGPIIEKILAMRVKAFRERPEIAEAVRDETGFLIR